MNFDVFTGRSWGELAPILVILLFLSGFFLHLGTAVAGVSARSYSKAVVAVLLGGLLGAFFSTALPKGSPIGLALDFAAVVFITKVGFRTDIWRAFVSCLVGGVLTAVAVILVVMLLSGQTPARGR
jgi:ABC-type enterobactin transport system permease subunit